MVIFCPFTHTYAHSITQYKIHLCICVMNVFSKEIKGKSHDEYPAHSSACMCVHVHGGLVSMLQRESLFLIFAACFFLSGLKAVFCILLTSSHLAEKVGVQAETESRMGNRQRQRGRRKTFYLCRWRTSPNQLSLQSQRAFHITIKKREKGGKGNRRGGWRQRVVRMTKVRNI